MVQEEEAKPEWLKGLAVADLLDDALPRAADLQGSLLL